MEKLVLTQKKFFLISEQHGKDPFAGRNTQQMVKESAKGDQKKFFFPDVKSKFFQVPHEECVKVPRQECHQVKTF